MRASHISLKIVQVISIVFILLFVNENRICVTAADAINRGYILEIVKQPEDVLTAANGYVMFYVESNRENVTYQWYYQRPGTTGWGKFGESGGGTSQTLNRYVPRSWNGWKVRCEVTDGAEKVVSEEATITIKEPLKIVKQPEDVLTAANGYVMFYVESNRENVTYQWYYQRPGTTGWGKFGESGGGTSQTLNRYVPRSWNGWKVRCEVTDGTEKVVSEEATITIKEIIPEVTIYLVSGDIEHGIKQNQSFCLTAEKKDAISLQWQMSEDGNQYYNIEDATNINLIFTHTLELFKSQVMYFRAVATSSTGNTAVSNIIEVLLLSEDELPIRPQSDLMGSNSVDNSESETVSEIPAAKTGVADSETADKVEDKSVSGVENNGTGLAEEL